MQAFAKLTHTRRRRAADHQRPAADRAGRGLLPPATAHEFEEACTSCCARTARTLQDDRRHLLERYRYVDLARKVVGVGSVGTAPGSCSCSARDNDDPLFLQCKEAQPSVLEPFAGTSEFDNHGGASSTASG